MSYLTPRWPEDDNKPLPEPTFIRKILGDVWESLFTLVVWGLGLWVLTFAAIAVGSTFVVLGLIVIAFTFAPGLAGLMVACANAARGGFARLGDAVRGTLRIYWRSVALALPLVILVALTFLTADVVRGVPDRQEMVISWALQIGLTLTVVILHIYLYPVLALYNTPLKKTVLLAGTLAGKFAWQTLVLLIFGGALFAASLLHPLVLLFVLGPWCVVATNATRRLARRIVPDQNAIDK